jgi:hypothetical protein
MARQEETERLVSNSHHIAPLKSLTQLQFLLRPILAPPSLVLRLGYPRKVHS